jgi:hypothetical protein
MFGSNCLTRTKLKIKIIKTLDAQPQPLSTFQKNIKIPKLQKLKVQRCVVLEAPILILNHSKG